MLISISKLHVPGWSAFYLRESPPKCIPSPRFASQPRSHRIRRIHWLTPSEFGACKRSLPGCIWGVFVLLFSFPRSLKHINTQKPYATCVKNRFFDFAFDDVGLRAWETGSSPCSKRDAEVTDKNPRRGEIRLGLVIKKQFAASVARCQVSLNSVALLSAES